MVGVTSKLSVTVLNRETHVALAEGTVFLLKDGDAVYALHNLRTDRVSLWYNIDSFFQFHDLEQDNYELCLREG